VTPVDDPVGDALGLDPDDEPPPNGHAPLTRCDLTGLMSQPRIEPRRFANRLMYPGKMHTITGEPESCKTLIAWWAALEVISLGRNVLVVDEEAGANQTAEMLSSFGADPRLVDKHLHYLDNPGLTYSTADMTRLGSVLHQHRPVLTIFDSQAALLAYAGVGENDPGAVALFWKRVIYPISRQFGSAVLVTDHDSKDGANSRYGRGSTAKLAEVEVAFKVVVVKPLTRHQDGIVTFSVVKDRPAWLHRNWQIRITRDPLALHWDKSATTVSPDGMSPAAKKLLDVLGDEPATVPALIDRLAAKYGHGLRHDTARKELTQLLDNGLADRIDQGTGRQALWLKRGNALPDSVPEPPPADPGWPAGSVGAAANE
jgi:AAA domain